VDTTNITTTGLAIVGGALLSYIVARFSKGHDARASAEAALIAAGPEMIKIQAARIEQLTTDNNNIWIALRKSSAEHEECLRRLGALERAHEQDHPRPSRED
jgi:hypothetical protein